MCKGNNNQDPDTMTTDQILKKAANIQKNDIDALDRAIANIEESKTIGAEIGTK